MIQFRMNSKVIIFLNLLYAFSNNYKVRTFLPLKSLGTFTVTTFQSKKITHGPVFQFPIITTV
jgi:hypothetical protein